MSEWMISKSCRVTFTDQKELIDVLLAPSTCLSLRASMAETKPGEAAGNSYRLSVTPHACFKHKLVASAFDL